MKDHLKAAKLYALITTSKSLSRLNAGYQIFWLNIGSSASPEHSQIQLKEKIILTKR